MATTEFLTPARSGGRFLHLVGSALGRAAAVVTAYRNRRAIAQLLMFDEHMLRDIGLTSGDVHSAMASRLSDDPSRYLCTAAEERRSAHRAWAREAQARARIRPVDDADRSRS